jgi:hypothetical protein
MAHGAEGMGERPSAIGARPKSSGGVYPHPIRLSWPAASPVTNQRITQESSPRMPALFFNIKHVKTGASKKRDNFGGNIFIRENLDILEFHAFTGSKST